MSSSKRSAEKNYLTPDGHRRLQAELKMLMSDERPKVVDIVAWAAGNGDRSENGDYIYGKKRLREIAEVVDPAAQTNRDQIFFGATVTYVDEDDRERTVRIVGVDEVRHDAGEISWRSPIARALLSKRKGDLVSVQTPEGEIEIEVIKVKYY
jgi:transcription elongation factor GreB